MSVTFSKVSGVLPLGVTIEENGRVKGFIDFENIEMNPFWLTPSGTLIEVDENEEVVIPPLQVSVREGRTFDSFTVIPKDGDKYGILPWGLSLHPLTGVIQGTVQEQYDSLSEKTWYDGDEPQWVTSESHLGDYFVGDEINTSIVAVSPLLKTVDFTIVEGTLPSGAFLNSLTGELTGTLDNISTGFETDLSHLYAKPTWTTVGGLLGTFNEFESVSVSISAVSNNNLADLYYTIVEGTLPSGLMLDSRTGEISGICDELKEGGLSVYDFGKAPIISHNIKINNEEIEVGMDEPILTLSEGDLVDFHFIVTAQDNRTILSYTIVDNHEATLNTLPFGLFLNATTGEVSGMIDSTTAKGEYEFYLNVVDSKFVYSIQKFKIVVQ